MATLTDYWFSDGFFSGPFTGWNQPFGSWAWISHGGNSNATLTWVRQDNESIVDLGAQLNNPLVLNAVDGVLGGQANRTSGIMAQGRFWPSVPYYGSNPARHSGGDMLVRVYFNFHISTPWYCSDANGDISYYLFFYLDGSGHLHGYVDGWSYNYGGGGPFCTGAINSALNSAIPAGIATVQNLLNTALALYGGSRFSMLYYLPGNGTRSPGGFSGNANTDVALALLPA